MKKISLLTFIFVFCLSINLKADYNKRVQKELKKYAAICEKEAARLEKEGWVSTDKTHSIGEQLYYANIMDEYDDYGNPMYIAANAVGIGATLNEAEQNAIDFAKLNLFYEMLNSSLTMEGRIIHETGYDTQSSLINQFMGETIYSIQSENEEHVFYWDAIRRTCFSLPPIRHAQSMYEMYRKIDDKFEVVVRMYCRNEGHCTKIGNLYYYLDFEHQKAEVTYHPSHTNVQNIVIPPTVSYKGVTYDVIGVCENAFYNCNISELRYPAGIDIAKIRIPSTAQYIEYNPQPPLLALKNETLLFLDASQNNCIDAEEESCVSFQIINKGKGEAANCEAKIKMLGSTIGIKTFNTSLPTIAAGQTCDVKIPISSDINTQDGKVTFSIEIVEPSGWGIAPFDLTVVTKAYEPPFMQVVDYNVASNSGRINKMEPFTLTFNIQNTKYGDAENVKVKIKLPKDIYIMDGVTEYSYPLIKSSDAKKINITLAANNNYQLEQIPISIAIQEKHGIYSENKDISLPIDKSARNNIIFNEKNETPKEIQLAMMNSDVDRDIPVSSEQNENTLVLVIANEHYQSMPIVPYAINDGNIFNEYCVKTLGIPEDNIMYQSDVTLNGFRQKVALLQKKVNARYNAGKDTRIIFYYTGHGMPDVNTQSAYLMPIDGFDENITTGYKLDDLYQLLGQMQATSVTVFLDACFSGVNRNDKALAVHKGARLTTKNGSPMGKMIVFAASQGNQTASVNDKEGHGLFTYFLLKKLKTTQGNVSLKELAEYLTAEVNIKSLDIFEKEQIPSIVASPLIENQWQNWKLK